MHRLSSAYWTITPVHISVISVAHDQGVESIHVENFTGYTSELTQQALLVR
jgi:hypothetical protein